MATTSCFQSILSTSSNVPSIDRPKFRARRRWIPCAALRSSPKGFGEASSSSSSSKRRDDSPSSSSPPIVIKPSNPGPDSRQEEDDDTVPEAVTNRMLKRMLVTVGVPLGAGFLAFPAFYFARSMLKLEFPQVMPMITSFLLFGLSGFGILYAVVSTSWDPLREGSLLGWDEARVNWDIVWQKRDEED